jgi:putative flippase GtrA
VPVSITLSYVTASGLSYLLNRSLNFRSHGALGVNYQLARVAAGLCEAAYMYLAMRWLVFRDVRASVTSRP